MATLFTAGGRGAVGLETDPCFRGEDRVVDPPDDFAVADLPGEFLVLMVMGTVGYEVSKNGGDCGRSGRLISVNKQQD